MVISIDYMADTVSDIALGEELIDMSPEDRMKVYDGAVQAVERYRNKDKEEKKRVYLPLRNLGKNRLLGTS